MLPEHVHRTESKGIVYYTFQRGRGTPSAGPRIRLPGDPMSVEFQRAYEAARSERKPELGGVAQMVRAYRQSQHFSGLAAATQRDYDRYLTLLEDRLGEYPTEAITPVVLQALHDDLSDKPSTAAHAISVIGACFKWAIPRGLANSNPAKLVDVARVETDGAEPWPQWAFDLIREHARWEVRVFVALAFYTGQRTKDVLAMSLEQITDTIPVKQSKTKKRLRIPIHSELAVVLEECRARGLSILVPDPRGEALDTNRWRALWGREVNKASMKRIREAGLSPHGLRKSAVCALAYAGCTDTEIASITGQSMAMVAHYKRLYDQESVARGAVLKWEQAA